MDHGKTLVPDLDQINSGSLEGLGKPSVYRVSGPKPIDSPSSPAEGKLD